MAADFKAPRSVYAQRLGEFPDIVFDSASAASHRGAWRSWFQPRIGTSFDQRVIFEIGCFDAAFLCKIAAKNPHTAFIGLDWKFKAIHDAARTVQALGLRNVALLRARAQEMSQFFAPLELDEIWIFHPDPCDRDVELKNRLIAEPFLLQAYRVLKDDAAIAFKTDHVGYYQWVLSLFGLPQPDWADPNRRVRHKDLMRLQDLPAPSDAVTHRFKIAIDSSDYWNDDSARAQTRSKFFAGETTLFEQRFLGKRWPIYYIEMRKRHSPSSTKR